MPCRGNGIAFISASQFSSDRTDIADLHHCLIVQGPLYVHVEVECVRRKVLFARLAQIQFGVVVRPVKRGSGLGSLVRERICFR